MPVWNPDEVGPFGRCLRCFHPYADHVAYCIRCGEVGPLFTVPSEASGSCYRHRAGAKAYCSLCGRQVCGDCIDTTRYSFMAGHEIYYCVECVDRIKEVESAFWRKLEETGWCAKHFGVKAVFHCISCKLPLCPQCAYFFIHPTSRHVENDPYCLACFRSEHIVRDLREKSKKFFQKKYTWNLWVSADQLR